LPFFGKNELQTQLSNLGIHLDKKRGQCYLIDRNIAEFMIIQANLDPIRDSVIEIGPGLGVLSDLLAANSKHLYLIELDKKIAEFLKNHFEHRFELQYYENIADWNNSMAKIGLLHGDALKSAFPPANKIVANIPYQISAPLIFKILENWQYDKVILMIQKEFADHLVAEPDSEKYTRLSAAASFFLDVKILKLVPAECYFPKPQVDSAIIELHLKEHVKNDNLLQYRELFLELIKGIFPYKNKGLKKAIKFYFDSNSTGPELFPNLLTSIEKEDIGDQRVRTFSPDILFKIALMGAGKQ
jgi:16S rRNA (adenine1518-N6/adenine1519-N6)-dimethyltransferase